MPEQRVPLWFNTSKSVFLNDDTLEGHVWKWIDSGNKALGKTLIYTEVIPFSYGTGLRPEVVVDIVQFGDGYDQVSEGSIRPVKDKFTAVFSKKSPEVALALQRFFKGEGQGSIYWRRVSDFFWVKIPSPFEATTIPARKFRCHEWEANPDTYGAVTIKATFIESFEP